MLYLIPASNHVGRFTIEWYNHKPTGTASDFDPWIVQKYHLQPFDNDEFGDSSDKERLCKMTKTTVREWLDLWHGLLGDPSVPPFKEPDDMAGVLADLRRFPDRLANAFAPLPCGDELLSRVKLCIDAEMHHDGIYLAPDALDTNDAELRELVADSILRGSQSCGIDPRTYPINIIRRAVSPSESRRAAPIVEELGDLYIGFSYDSRGLENDAMQFLREPLYTLAASFEVQGYCLTPLCPERIRRIDPYKPQIDLWLRGAHAVVRWEDGSDNLWVDVFVDS